MGLYDTFLYDTDTYGGDGIVYTRMKEYLPDYYNDIIEIDSILSTEAIEIEELIYNADIIYQEVYVDTATENGLKRSEKNIFNITVPIGATIDERRSVIKSVLRGTDKLSATVIKNISLAYQYGDVEVTFTGGNIVVKFSSTIGIPPNIESLKTYLNERIPSHLGITYVYKYISISEVEAMTLSEFETTLTLDKLAF